MNTIAETIKQKRLEKGWSIYRLAQELGLFYSTVYGWENGRAPRNTSIKKLEKVLGPVGK